MDALPWPAITAATGGWILFAAVAWLVIRKLISGDLVTRRETDAKDETIAVQRRTIDQQGQQLSLVLGEAMPTTNAVLWALKRAAEEQQ